mgnify:CR=1 FL=1
MPSNAVHLHCVLQAAPDKGYKAFLDADALCRWPALTFHQQHR